MSSSTPAETKKLGAAVSLRNTMQRWNKDQVMLAVLALAQYVEKWDEFDHKTSDFGVHLDISEKGVLTFRAGSQNQDYILTGNQLISSERCLICNDTKPMTSCIKLDIKRARKSSFDGAVHQIVCKKCAKATSLTLKQSKESA